MSYCKIVDAEIAVSTCPLRKGHCMWQDRKTNICKYSDTVTTHQEFAAQVGLAVLSEGEYQARYEQVRAVLTSKVHHASRNRNPV